jgi:AcrR family transcriptional regulator
MGINRPSLYAAFGNKESLFRKVVDRYLQCAGRLVADSLAEPKIRDALSRLLTMSLPSHKSTRPRGCLLVNGALACAEESEPIRQELARRRRQIESAVRARLEQAIADGELRPTANVTALAKFIETFRNGLAVEQAGGAAKDDLLAAVNLAMKAIDAELDD